MNKARGVVALFVGAGVLGGALVAAHAIGRALILAVLPTPIWYPVDDLMAVILGIAASAVVVLLGVLAHQVGEIVLDGLGGRR